MILALGHGAALTDRGFPLCSAQKAAGRGWGWAGVPWGLVHLSPSQGGKSRRGSQAGEFGAGFPTCLGVPIDSCQIRSDGESSCKREPGRIRLGFLVSLLPSARERDVSGFLWVAAIFGVRRAGICQLFLQQLPSPSFSSGLN